MCPSNSSPERVHVQKTALDYLREAPIGHLDFRVIGGLLCDLRASSGLFDQDFPLHGIVGLRSLIALSFPPSDVGHLTWGAKRGDRATSADKAKAEAIASDYTGAHSKPLAAGQSPSPSVWLNVLSLGGLHGPLPWHLSERILERYRAGGDALHDFLDMLNFRFWELFILAYRTGAHPQFGASRRQAGFVARLARSVVGLYSESDAVPEFFGCIGVETLRYGLLAGPNGLPASETSLLLSQALGVRTRLDEFQSMSLPVAKSARVLLGGSLGPRLGKGSVLGNLCKVAHSGMTIRLFLSSAEQIDALVPGHAASRLRQMSALIAFACNDNVHRMTVAMSVTLVDAETTTLGANRTRLSWGARLSSRAPVSCLLRVSSRRLHTFLNEESRQ